jgi:hypothetical protein
MTIYYLDYELGNDANNGLTFASSWKTLANNTAVAGDTIRIKAAPDPTSMGITGTWTDGGYNYTTGAIVPISTSNTSPIVVLANTGHGFVTGDTLGFTGHLINVNANGMWTANVVGNDITLLNADGSNSNGVISNAGANTGIIRKWTNSVVTLSTPLTKNIAITGNQGSYVNWTANTNATTSILTNTTSIGREGNSYQQILIALAFTTGRAAYYPTGLLDLSGYQQISFWAMLGNSTIIIPNNFSISLCSDTLGLVPVNTFILPTFNVLAVWHNMTIDFGAPLSSGINSISFNVLADQGTQTISLNNIIACRASSNNSSLTLSSLIGKTPANTEPFLGIMSINGTRVVLDLNTTTNIATPLGKIGYAGTTETTLAYKQECIRAQQLIVATSDILFLANTTGTAANTILYSGGWDRTNMSTQVGESYFDGIIGQGYLFNSSITALYNNFERISGVRYNRVYSILGDSNNILSAKDLNHNTNGISFSASNCTSNVNNVWCNTNGVVVAQINNKLYINRVNSNSSSGINIGGSNHTFNNITFNNNNTGYSGNNSRGVNNYVINGIFKNNTTTYITGNPQSDSYFYNCTFIGGIVFTPTTKHNSIAWSMQEGGIVNNHYGYLEGGLIFTSAGSIRHTLSGVAWGLTPTTSIRTISYPIRLKIVTVGLTAGIPLTIKAWFYRDDITNLVGRMKVVGGIVGGTIDTVVYASAAINTWEQLSITMTSTETGVVEVYAECWSTAVYTGTMYVDDVTFV